MGKVILGIDPSSTTSGACLADDKNVIEIGLFEAEKHAGLHFNLARFQQFLQKFHDRIPIDLVVVERVAVARSMTTIRMLAYYEAAAMLKAAEWHSELELMEVSRARKLALGKGNLSKQQAYDIVKKDNSRGMFRPFDRGGSDQSDSYIAAMAGYKI